MKHRWSAALLAGFIMAVALCFTACGGNGGNGGNGGSNGDGGDGGNSQTEEGGGQDDEQQKYSDFLYALMEDDYYNDLIARAKADKSLLGSPLFDPHPYTFLQQKGHNVEKIKAGELKCKTMSYIKDKEPNNLYIITYVEDEGSIPYYTEYLLKVALTDQEVADYKMVHRSTYADAVFIHDQIAKSKNLQIVSECKMSVEAHDGLKKDLEIRNLGYYFENKAQRDFLLQGYSVEDQTFNILIYERREGSMPTQNRCKIGTLVASSNLQKLQINEDIFCGPYTYGNYRISSTNLKNFTDNIEQVSVFNTQGANRALRFDGSWRE